MSDLELLEHSYAMSCEVECQPLSRMDWLGDDVFNFTTYDHDMSELFATKAVEVCAALNKRETFEYIEDPENYKWFLLMCNMPFFADRIEWGTSVRGAWWIATTLDTCALWVGPDQIIETIKFTVDEWKQFTAAIVEFSTIMTEVQP